MKHRRWLESIASAWLVICSPAQAAAPPAAPAASSASAPAPAKPVRRALTPEQLRDTAQFPDGSQPEQPLVPQVVIPFGKRPPPATTASAAGSGAAASAGPKVNEQVARCKALSTPGEQAACVHAPPASAAAAR